MWASRSTSAAQRTSSLSPRHSVVAPSPRSTRSIASTARRRGSVGATTASAGRRLAVVLMWARDVHPVLVRAIASHADFMGVSRDSPMEKTLYAVDELSGFVLACAYVRPQGLEGMTPKSVKKKLKTPAFAPAVNREEVRAGAEQLGVDFDDHIALVIGALQARADALGVTGSA